jgi:nitric oxide reductase activation protein
VDVFLRMQLLDLARTLAQNPDLRLDVSYHSSYHADTAAVDVSQFWRDYPPEAQRAGWKSDVYLRCIGSAWFSDREEIARFLQWASNHPLSRLAKNLFSLCEDLRLESICTSVRPGTFPVFRERRSLFLAYFKRQAHIHLMRGEETDAFFSSLYVWQASGWIDPQWPDGLMQALKRVQTPMSRIPSAGTTVEVAQLCREMIERISQNFSKDMAASYFSTHAANGSQKPLASGKEAVKMPVEPGHRKKWENDDRMDRSRQEEDGQEREKLSTWHRETKDPSQSFLQFEQEQGTPADRLIGTARESDPGDQALALVQGSARQSKQNEYGDREELLRRLAGLTGGNPGDYGEINRAAQAEFLLPETPAPEDRAAYARMKEQIAPFQRHLTRLLQTTLEKKRQSREENLPFGRFSAKLIRLFTDQQWRLFYKKRSPGRPIDAAFLLLVDCSASMADKMEETHLGILLFHEVLRTLQIPHAVVGFWEDAVGGTGVYPNRFRVVIDFSHSLSSQIGVNVLQLTPEQDNRDGYAIRVMTRLLQHRTEKHKVLLVFTDGQPAATDYAEDGIVDTCQAVWQARRLGVDVIGVYLANGEVDEQEQQTLQMIYGSSRVVVPQAAELPRHLMPVLRKLLLKAI